MGRVGNGTLKEGQWRVWAKGRGEGELSVHAGRAPATCTCI